jgi:hypothetical protein
MPPPGRTIPGAVQFAAELEIPVGSDGRRQNVYEPLANRGCTGHPRERVG